MSAVAVKRARGTAPAEPNAGTRPLDATKVFAASSYWGDNPLPATAPLLNDARVPAWLSNLAYQLGLDAAHPTADGKFLNLRSGATDGMAWFNLSTGSSPVYLPPADQPLVPVAQWNVVTPGAPAPWLEARELHEQMMLGVPIPPGALIDPSTDGSLVIYQPSTGYYGDFWRFAWQPGLDPQGRPYQAVAHWGGVMRQCWSRSGSFLNRTVDGVRIENERMGHTASGMAMIGGIITPEEWNDPSTDSIRHPLHFVIGQAAASLYLTPAHRTDGGGQAASTMPEGARFRLDPTWNLGYLNPAVKRDFYALKLAKALQRYGAFCTDITHAGCAFRFRSPITWDWADQLSPYVPTGVAPNLIMRAIPWHKLLVLNESVSPE